MMTSDDKVGGWVKKGQNHDDVILEWSLIKNQTTLDGCCHLLVFLCLEVKNSHRPHCVWCIGVCDPSLESLCFALVPESTLIGFVHSLSIDVFW